VRNEPKDVTCSHFNRHDRCPSRRCVCAVDIAGRLMRFANSPTSCKSDCRKGTSTRRDVLHCRKRDVANLAAGAISNGRSCRTPYYMARALDAYIPYKGVTPGCVRRSARVRPRSPVVEAVEIKVSFARTYRDLHICKPAVKKRLWSIGKTGRQPIRHTHGKPLG